MGKKFQYTKRSAQDVQDRASQQGGQFDRPIRDGIKSFTPKPDTKYRIRVMPPTWDDAKHFGYDVFIVYGVGTDNTSYLSLAKMKGKKDPMEEERFIAEKDGDQEATKQLTPKKRVGMYIIDRASEDEGPQLWLAPFTFDRDLSSLLVDSDTGKVLDIDDPDEGYDVTFQRQGSNLQTKYIGLQISRRESSLNDDKDTHSDWMNQIIKAPIPETLNYFSYDHIHKTLHGGIDGDGDADDSNDREENDEEEETTTRRKLGDLKDKRKENKKDKKGKKDKKEKKKGH